METDFSIVEMLLETHEKFILLDHNLNEIQKVDILNTQKYFKPSQLSFAAPKSITKMPQMDDRLANKDQHNSSVCDKSNPKRPRSKMAGDSSVESDGCSRKKGSKSRHSSKTIFDHNREIINEIRTQIVDAINTNKIKRVLTEQRDSDDGNAIKNNVNLFFPNFLFPDDSDPNKNSVILYRENQLKIFILAAILHPHEYNRIFPSLSSNVCFRSSLFDKDRSTDIVTNGVELDVIIYSLREFLICTEGLVQPDSITIVSSNEEATSASLIQINAEFLIKCKGFYFATETMTPQEECQIMGYTSFSIDKSFSMSLNPESAQNLRRIIYSQIDFRNCIEIGQADKIEEILTTGCSKNGILASLPFTFQIGEERVLISPIYFCFMSILASQWPSCSDTDSSSSALLLCDGVSIKNMCDGASIKNMYQTMDVDGQKWKRILISILTAINADFSDEECELMSKFLNWGLHEKYGFGTVAARCEFVLCPDGVERNFMAALMHAVGYCCASSSIDQRRQKRGAWIASVTAKWMDPLLNMAWCSTDMVTDRLLFKEMGECRVAEQSYLFQSTKNEKQYNTERYTICRDYGLLMYAAVHGQAVLVHSLICMQQLSFVYHNDDDIKTQHPLLKFAFLTPHENAFIMLSTIKDAIMCRTNGSMEEADSIALNLFKYKSGRLFPKIDFNQIDWFAMSGICDKNNGDKSMLLHFFELFGVLLIDPRTITDSSPMIIQIKTDVDINYDQLKKILVQIAPRLRYFFS